uniref:RNA-dependent RNA polymerase n=1 Tax=Erysiphales ourmia-like virus 3 TaxID=2719869 RepID=A0A6G9ELI8_9VIRU|nr:RNA-dependent RNA polymerase [Erysiphales ourmia-like virus 3]
MDKTKKCFEMFTFKHCDLRCSKTCRKPLKKRGQVAEKCCNRYISALRQTIFRQALPDLNYIYDCKVRCISLKDLSCKEALKRTKEWMEGPEISRALRRKGRSERLGGRMAFKLLKKCLPTPCKCFGDGIEEWKAARQIPACGTIPNGFYKFLRKEVREIFPIGWDKGFYKAISENVVNTSSCTERSGKFGGAAVAFDIDQYLLDVQGLNYIDSGTFSFKIVETSGKRRPLTIMPARYNCLRPVHKILFDRLRKEKWCLIGDPTPEKFKRAGFKYKDKILSGDYKSATDNLDLRISHAILEELLDTSTSIPDELKDFCLRSLYPTVNVLGEEITVKRGQMMGSFLSFPLLCLYNRICSKFSLGNCPMLINGDDIVVETKNPSRWFDNMELFSLEPESSKTSVSKDYAEINSTVFSIGGGSLSPTDIVRSRSLRKVDCLPSSIGSCFYGATRRISGAIRDRTAEVFSRNYGKLINYFISHGIPWEDFSFSGRLAKRILFPRFVKNVIRASRRFRSPNTLPIPNQVDLMPTRRFYGKLDATQNLMDCNRRFCAFAGVNRVNPNARSFIREALDSVRSSVPGEMPEPLFDRGFLKFRIKGFLCDNRNSLDYYFGKPCSLNRYKAFLRNSFRSLPMKSTFIHEETYLSLCFFQRYGLKSGMR